MKTDLLHINPLEFLAIIIIYVWLCLYFIRCGPVSDGGSHLVLVVDEINATRSHKRPIRNLAASTFGIADSRNSKSRGQTLAGKGQLHCRPSVSSGTVPVVGLRYQSILPVPRCRLCRPYRIPFGLTVHATSQMDFTRRDHGHIRRVFRRWCDCYSVRLGDLYALAPQGIIILLGQYLLDVAQGKNLQKRPDLQDST